ncbi:hypothetical protein FS842_011085 [Serendipita sp. 407]|nr:hypothetical protein FS842_011085 [Serendipita sp. 407]
MLHKFDFEIFNDRLELFLYHPWIHGLLHGQKAITNDRPRHLWWDAPLFVSFSVSAANRCVWDAALESTWARAEATDGMMTAATLVGPTAVSRSTASCFGAAFDITWCSRAGVADDDVEIHTPGAPPDPVHFPFTTDAFTVARVESRAVNAATRGSFIATEMIELLGGTLYSGSNAPSGPPPYLAASWKMGNKRSQEKFLRWNHHMSPHSELSRGVRQYLSIWPLKGGGDEFPDNKREHTRIFLR